MNIDQSVQYYWNSNTRFNKPVKVIGVNDENYAVEADGHVFVVPKANIAIGKKAPPVYVPPVTTALKPDGEYWFTLTSEDWSWLRSNRNRNFLSGEVWNNAIAEILVREHVGLFTNEWFSLSSKTANEILVRYHYHEDKHRKDISSRLPGASFTTIVQQLWAEKLRRDGIVPNG